MPLCDSPTTDAHLVLGIPAPRKTSSDIRVRESIQGDVPERFVFSVPLQWMKLQGTWVQWVHIQVGKKWVWSGFGLSSCLNIIEIGGKNFTGF